jgi:hypothetical protein
VAHRKDCPIGTTPVGLVAGHTASSDEWSYLMQTSASPRSAPYDGSPQAFQGRQRSLSEGTVRHGDARAAGLGWFSIGLGLTQLTAPNALSRVIGLRPDERIRSTMLLLGLRELSAGVGLLAQERPNGWLWARVAGDVMDLTLLGRALAGRHHRRDNLMLATGAVAGVLALDYLAARAPSPSRTQAQRARSEKQRVNTTVAVSVNRPRGEVEARWRQYEDSQQTGIDVAFAEAPGGKLTELRARHARLQGPHVLQELRHFKQVVETGEVVHSDASIHRGLHPAQPSRTSRKKAMS